MCRYFESSLCRCTVNRCLGTCRNRLSRNSDSRPQGNACRQFLVQFALIFILLLNSWFNFEQSYSWFRYFCALWCPVQQANRSWALLLWEMAKPCLSLPSALIKSDFYFFLHFSIAADEKTEKREAKEFVNRLLKNVPKQGSTISCLNFKCSKASYVIFLSYHLIII